MVGIAQVEVGELFHMRHATHERSSVDVELGGCVSRVLTVAQKAHEGARVFSGVEGVVGGKLGKCWMASLLRFELVCALRHEVVESVVGKTVVPVMRIADLPDFKGPLGFHEVVTAL